MEKNAQEKPGAVPEEKKPASQPEVVPTENAADKDVIPAKQTLQQDPQNNPTAQQGELNTDSGINPDHTTVQPNIVENDEQHQTIDRLMKAREERFAAGAAPAVTLEEKRAMRAELLSGVIGQTNEIGKMLESKVDPQAPENVHGETSPMDPNHDSVRIGPEGTQEQNPPVTLAELQERYKSLTGKPASAKWDINDIRAQIEKEEKAKA